MSKYDIDEAAYSTKLKSAKPSVVKIVHDPFKVVSDGELSTLLKLLNDPVNPVSVTKSRWSGFTLLHRAASQGNTDIVQVLLERGARINERTVWGWHTPLHLALSNGWDETAKFLINAGADIHAKNKDGDDMCDYAVKRGYKILGNEFRVIAANLESQRKLKERRIRAAEASRKNELAELETRAAEQAAAAAAAAAATATATPTAVATATSTAPEAKGSPKQKHKKKS